MEDLLSKFDDKTVFTYHVGRQLGGLRGSIISYLEDYDYYEDLDYGAELVFSGIVAAMADYWNICHTNELRVSQMAAAYVSEKLKGDVPTFKAFRMVTEVLNTSDGRMLGKGIHRLCRQITRTHHIILDVETNAHDGIVRIECIC